MCAELKKWRARAERKKNGFLRSRSPEEVSALNAFVQSHLVFEHKGGVADGGNAEEGERGAQGERRRHRLGTWVVWVEERGAWHGG